MLELAPRVEAKVTVAIVSWIVSSVGEVATAIRTLEIVTAAVVSRCDSTAVEVEFAMLLTETIAVTVAETQPQSEAAQSQIVIHVPVSEAEVEAEAVTAPLIVAVEIVSLPVAAASSQVLHLALLVSQLWATVWPRAPRHHTIDQSNQSHCRT